MAPAHDSRGSRRRARVLAAAAAGALSLALAQEARAQGPLGAEALPELPRIVTIGGAPPLSAPLGGQAATQASQTGQAAGAQATSQQTLPTNVALLEVIESPGAKTTIAQVNDSAAGASSGNGSSTKQASGQSQGGAGSSPAQSTAQAGQTGQTAGSQASSQQVMPANVAVPVIVSSPGAITTIVQANSSAAGAASTNGSTTTQTGGQEAGAGSPGTTPISSPIGSSGISGAAVGAPGSSRQIFGAELDPGGATWIWTWTWNWTWSTGQLPAELRPPAWEPREAGGGVGDGGPTGSPASSKPSSTALGTGAQAPARPPDTRSGSGAVPRGEARRAPGGRPVETRASVPPALPPLLPGPAVPAPAPAPGGSLFSPAGLLLAALAALAFSLSEAPLALGRRLRLSAAAWRRLACVSPLERPG